MLKENQSPHLTACVSESVELCNWRKGYGDVQAVRVFLDGRIEAVIRRPHCVDKVRVGHLDNGRVRFAGTSAKLGVAQ